MIKTLWDNKTARTLLQKLKTKRYDELRLLNVWLSVSVKVIRKDDVACVVKAQKCLELLFAT